MPLRRKIETMKAAVIRKYGGPNELKFEDLPDPVLASAEVLVKTCATSINPIDLKMRSGVLRDFFPGTFPAVLGVDVSGTVAAVSADVKSFSIGDRVFTNARKAYATLCLVKAEELAKVPDGMDLASAAALPTVTTTEHSWPTWRLALARRRRYWSWVQSETSVVPPYTG